MKSVISVIVIRPTTHRTCTIVNFPKSLSPLHDINPNSSFRSTRKQEIDSRGTWLFPVLTWRAQKACSPLVVGDGAISGRPSFCKLGAREFRAKKHVINDFCAARSLSHLRGKVAFCRPISLAHSRSSSLAGAACCSHRAPEATEFLKRP